MRALRVDAKLQPEVLRVNLEAAAAGQPIFGPEESTAVVEVVGLKFLPHDGEGLLMKCCCVTRVAVLEGLLPVDIPKVILDEELTWDGPIDRYLTARLSLVTNGHTKVVSARFELAPVVVLPDPRETARRQRSNSGLRAIVARMFT